MDSIIKSVKKPSRYINSEWNSIHKNSGGIRLCLCFPDLYELGASNLGLEILYQIINSRADASAERCYCPDKDLEDALKAAGMPLFSIETRSPLKDFDVLGFSLQYELCYTNVLTMLHSAGIPFKSAERESAKYPLIIAGGPICYNPEPMADFFDMFVIGDGEDAINELIDQIRNCKASGRSRPDTLAELSKISGVYVPLVHAGKPGVKITKRTVDVEKSFYPVKPIVPYVQTVHDRLNIEISRGCIHNCRFCQATNIYHGWRARSQEKIMGLIEQGIKNTGYDELSLSSLSVSSYPQVTELVKQVNAFCLNKSVSFSVPSLRCGKNSIELMPYLIYPKRANLTFAIEAGSERLRRVIGKEISENDIYSTMVSAGNYGWKLIKLYFMIGLPGEKDEDIDAIINMVNRLVKLTPRISYNVTISPFIPKPHSPFQWCAMENENSLFEKRKALSRKLKASVKAHNINMSAIEAVFARGDRKLSGAVISAWSAGARFDHWHEYFRNDIWNAAFSENGIDKNFYMGARKTDELLPWSHIIAGRQQDYLLKEYEQSFREADLKSEPVQESQLIEAQSRVSASWQNSQLSAGVGRSQKFICRIRFGRKGVLKYLSHLEQVELIRKIFRRTSLPVKYSEGFHPQMVMAFGPAISVGYESSCEIVDVQMREQVDIKVIAGEIVRQLPGNFELLEIKQISQLPGSIDSTVNLIEYEARGLSSGEAALIRKITDEFLSKKEMPIKILKKGAEVAMDLRLAVKNLEFDGNVLKMFIRFGPNRNVKPEKALECIFQLTPAQINLINIERKTIYIENPDGSIKKFF
ncbi:MAG: hypothetical protein A2297_02740 [Elusimicrobia bacterium RIFOXYB2_FULL_48_7]|nr:MAG: hypothetical protein A2297_02740 [Elusimicrobia bacterium RIFOXYB2_FULL_48_7]